MKKYRCIRAVNREINLDRRKLGKVETKSIVSKRRNRVNFDKAKAELSEKVVFVLERDDNSRLMPGKKDFKKVAKRVSKRKRMLNNHLRNLYLKFISENFRIKISLSSFCRMRPTHSSLVSYNSRNACFCTKHQNFALKLKTITSVGGKLKLDSHLPKKVCFICYNDSPSKMMKNAFYFILKALLVLKIFKFLS